MEFAPTLSYECLRFLLACQAGGSKNSAQGPARFHIEFRLNSLRTKTQGSCGRAGVLDGNRPGRAVFSPLSGGMGEPKVEVKAVEEEEAGRGALLLGINLKMRGYSHCLLYVLYGVQHLLFCLSSNTQKC